MRAADYRIPIKSDTETTPKRKSCTETDVRKTQSIEHEKENTTQLFLSLTPADIHGTEPSDH